MIEQQRADDDRKKRQKEKEEEQARRHAELKKKREEEELRRKEQAAALAVRKVIQRVRIATPENYDALRSELEEVQAANLEHMGTQAERVSQEAEKALQQAQQRIDEIHKKREEDEKQRIEEERRRKEEAEKVEKLMKEATEDVDAAEEKVKEATDMAKPFSDGQDDPPEIIVTKAQAAEKVIESARTSLEEASKNLSDKRKEMGDTSAAQKVRKEMGDLSARLGSGKRTLEKLGGVVTSAREKAARKDAALKKQAEEKELFTKYDADGDEKLSRSEVMSFAQAEYKFEVPEQILDGIMKQLDPIDYDKFHRMRTKVGVAMTEAKARIRRAEEEERKKVIAERKAQVQTVIDEAAEKIGVAEKGISEAEGGAKPLANGENMTVDAIKEAVAATEALLKTVEEALADATEKLKKVEEECAAEEALKGHDKRDCPRLQSRQSRVQSRVDKVTGITRQADELAVRKAYAEIEQHRADAVTAIRAHMNAQSKTGEQLFDSIADGTALCKDKFAVFLKEVPDLEIAEEKIEKLFGHIASEANEINKERFLELIRLFYKCVKATVVTADIEIKSKTVRRLDLGEVLEAVEGPVKEDGAGVQRVKCQAVNDSAVGWVTIAGNQGTPFLEPGGNLYTCVKKTVLTDGLSVQDSKTVRSINVGETIEVLEFHKKDETVGVTRIKGKAKQDGVTGWITVAGNQGTAYLEPC